MEYDAVVVGSGPNGLSAAIVLRQAGLAVLLVESRKTVGGGLRSDSLTLPGFVHDVCSAIHPFALASPFFRSLPLREFGVEFIHPPLCAAHPLDGGTAAVLDSSLERTAVALGADARGYRKLMQPLLDHWPAISRFVFDPFGFPAQPLSLFRFGMKALLPATVLAKRYFREDAARSLFAGMAAHSILPLDRSSSAAAALVLLLMGHSSGWGFPKGGSQRLADALANYFVELGGVIQTGWAVRQLEELPQARAILLDLGPRQLLSLASNKKLPVAYRRQLQQYRYGPGICKLDWALSAPIPFLSEECRRAGTVHLGGTQTEIADSESLVHQGISSNKPFVLLAQPSLFDSSRAPSGKHTAWAYCHVPSGSGVDMTEPIESQVERFAPGFRSLILARHLMTAPELQEYNPNCVGGDISGGVMNLRQLFARPTLRYPPYRTALHGIYLCSSSTPPGPAVHGLCGYHAARRALRDLFGIRKGNDGFRSLPTGAAL